MAYGADTVLVLIDLAVGCFVEGGESLKVSVRPDEVRSYKPSHQLEPIYQTPNCDRGNPLAVARGQGPPPLPPGEYQFSSHLRWREWHL